jgi:hypothetical protein
MASITFASAIMRASLFTETMPSYTARAYVLRLIATDPAPPEKTLDGAQRPVA